MKIFLFSLLCMSFLVANSEFEAKLAGHIVISSQTKIKPPKDAPKFLESVGKFSTNSKTKHELINGVSLPFLGQAIQGHSGIKVFKDEVFVVTDNGLGKKGNSFDSMLYLNKYKFDFQKGTHKHLQTIFFNDKNEKYPFFITLENTKTRYLTGADFDPESFQIVNESIWVGEEFGPFLLEFDNFGTLKQYFEVMVDDKIIKSPDNPTLNLNAKPELNEPNFSVRRSKGFEGMASFKDKLYLLLEGSLYEKKQYENVKGKNYLRIIEFDTKNKKFSGKTYKYFLENGANSIGDFNMIDENYGLIIERDDSEGVANKACKSKKQENCFKNPAKFKRVYKIKLDEKSLEAKKIAFIDLMKIKDENHISKKELVDNHFVFPFLTIENVDIVDDKHIIVANDNNYPFSASRELGKADDNEFILLEVKDFLGAK